MEHKVLIADDSLTIQKVIKITLANEPFELSDCSDPDALSNVVRETEPEIVLLDFNLSENKTGYDLCREIKQINPQIGVLMLFGTFDTIDEELLLECGCNYHIVKPFDGSKFINLCRALAQDFQSGRSDGPSIENADQDQQAELPSPIENNFGEDDWVMNQPEVNELSQDEAQAESLPHHEPNDLAREVEEWGMEVPSIIGAEGDSSPEVPEVIEDSTEESSEEREFVVPDSLQEEEQAPEEIEVPGALEIELIQDEPESEEAALEAQEIEMSTGTESEEELQNLQSQIEDEPEEEALWAADVVEDSNALDNNEEIELEESPSEEFSAMNADTLDRVDDESDYTDRPSEEITDDDVPEDFPEAIEPSSFPEEKQIVANTVASTEEISEKIQEELEGQLGSKLSPLVEKYVKEYCREQIERVAWEVIPDLAENIIKKEIQKISNSIMDQ